MVFDAELLEACDGLLGLLVGDGCVGVAVDEEGGRHGGGEVGDGGKGTGKGRQAGGGGWLHRRHPLLPNITYFTSRHASHPHPAATPTPSSPQPKPAQLGVKTISIPRLDVSAGTTPCARLVH